MVKKIPLTQGKTAIVDDEDYPWLNQFKWYVSKGSVKSREIYYIRRTENSKKIYMHRQLMNAKKGELVDHINGNTLDNRRQNLRIVTQRENQLNRHAPASSKLYGAIWHKRQKKWMSQITCFGKSRFIGYFNTEIEAHEAYKKVRKEVESL